MSERHNLEKIIRVFAFRLRRDFAEELKSDPRAFKRRCVHLLKVELPPGPGRPCGQSVTLALTMRDQGKEWSKIYPLCIEGYESLSPESRQLAQRQLRDSCRARRKPRKRKKSLHFLPTRTMHAGIVSSSQDTANPLV